MHIYNTPEVLALLRSIVEEVGEDHVYTPSPNRSYNSPNCRYFNEDGPAGHEQYTQWGTPECIVGHVLKRIGVHGVPLYCEGIVPCQPTEFMQRTYDWWRSMFSENALWVLRAAQAVQDQFGTWGHALAAAEREALVHP